MKPLVLLAAAMAPVTTASAQSVSWVGAAMEPRELPSAVRILAPDCSVDRLRPDCVVVPLTPSTFKLSNSSARAAMARAK